MTDPRPYEANCSICEDTGVLPEAFSNSGTVYCSNCAVGQKKFFKKTGSMAAFDVPPAGTFIRDGGHADYTGTETYVFNPKQLRAEEENKARLRTVPLHVLLDDAAVYAHGADKYGRFNWRESQIHASTYVEAILRHLIAWADGEDIDPDSGINHLNHIRACCGVVLDADRFGKVIDDRTRAEKPE